nr:response regulator [Candidatus Omnitrophota bacterium]
MQEKTSILIVDDEVSFCKTIAKILSRKGYETATAENGFKALGIIKKRAYDVVLMDIRMPGMNGVEAYKKIKAMRPGAIAILMTAFSVDELIKEAQKEGVYATLHKPLVIDVLINSIERAKNSGPLLAIVDDDPGICKTMGGILKKKGYKVSICGTGEEAISIAKEKPSDVLFIDMKLPALNGLETYLEIKRINPNAIAVMMTAYETKMEDLVKQALEEGAYICLLKPFDMDEVLRLIDEISQKIRRRKVPVENIR